MSEAPELGSMVHYVMPDMSCRIGFVTKVMGLAVNLAVLPEGPEDITHHLFRHPHNQQMRPLALMAGVSPTREPPQYVPAAKALEEKHKAAEKARHDTDMAAAKTDEEKQAVSAPSEFAPPSPEALEAAEDQQEEAHAQAIKDASIGTYHAPADHEAFMAMQRDHDMRKANRELEKVKAKHAAHTKAIKEKA